MCDCACVLLCDASHGRLRSLVVQSSWHYGDDAGGAEADCILQETPDEGAGISVVHVVQGVALCQLPGQALLAPHHQCKVCRADILIKQWPPAWHATIY